MDKARLEFGSVPVRVAAKVYGRDPAWVRAGIITGWLPIGEATRNGQRITDIKQKVNKEAVQNIIGEFVYSGIFIMEVVLSEEDRPNSRAIITAMRDFISTNNLAVGLHERAGRIFLRNDAVPVCLMIGYPRGIVNASKRNRWKIENC